MGDDQSTLERQLQEDLETTFLHHGCPYSNAGVLVLYWHKDDFTPSCAEEAQKVITLFRGDFHYNTEQFEIPMENSHNQLEHAISRFKLKYDFVSNLLVVYYSGHGDRERSSGKAIWAA